MNAGLALTSHHIGILSTATVDNYLITGELPSLSLTADVTLAKSVALQWIATLESNIRSFVVERSIDNVKYSDMVTVPAITNGKYTQTYQYEDKQPHEGINYYRLRLNNLDSTAGYSATVYARVSKANAPLLYPNPVTKGLVNIQQGEEAIKTITIYDISGHLMTRLNNSPEYIVIEIPVATFSNGIYVLEIKTASSVFLERLVIQN